MINEKLGGQITESNTDETKLEDFEGKELSKDELIAAMNMLNDGEMLTVKLQEPIKRRTRKQ